MRSNRPILAVVAAVALATGAAGCGNDDNTSATAPATTTAAVAPPANPGPPAVPIPSSPTATFVFDAGVLKPPVLRVPRVSSLRLVLISADGRPHAASITVGKKASRIVVQPNGRGELQLNHLQRGHRYRVVPDGAAEPVTLRVG